MVSLRTNSPISLPPVPNRTPVEQRRFLETGSASPSIAEVRRHRIQYPSVGLRTKEQIEASVDEWVRQASAKADQAWNDTCRGLQRAAAEMARKK